LIRDRLAIEQQSGSGRPIVNNDRVKKLTCLQEGESGSHFYIYQTVSEHQVVIHLFGVNGLMQIILLCRFTEQTLLNMPKSVDCYIINHITATATVLSIY